MRQVAVHLEEAVPRTLLRRGVWRGNCALEELFARRERLAGGGRHKVWRCSGGEGGGEFAVKEYDLADARTCLREAFAAKRCAIDALAEIEPDFPEVLPGDCPGPPAADSEPSGARTLGRES